MNWDELRKDLFTIISVMDDLIDENYPNHALKEQAEMSRKYRNIGIGFMGFADMLIALRLRYDSPDAIKMAHKVAKFMFKTSIYASAKLGEYRGNFPGYDPMIWKSEIIRENFTDEEIIELSKHNRLRNCSLLSIAPTGSLSTMLGISGGIEPEFQIAEFVRKTQIDGEWKDYVICPQIVTEYRKFIGRDVPINELPDYFVGAMDIDPYKRIEMQGTIQKCIDTAISSTLNLPRTTTLDTVKSIYLTAWLRGLKGVTIYVDGSRDPILRSKDTKEPTKSSETTTDTLQRVIPKRPPILQGRLVTTKANGEDFHIIIGLHDNKPYEVFAVPAVEVALPIREAEGYITKVGPRHYVFEGEGSTGTEELVVKLDNIAIDSDDNPVIYNLSMLVSGLLRHNMPINSIIKLLNKCNPVITSPHRAIIKTLSKYAQEDNTEKCPICGGKLIHENGCKHCENGDWSACFYLYAFN